jgi:hypothetical protein
MPADVWQLKVNGVTKTFPVWGIKAPARIDAGSKVKGSMSVETTEDFDDAGQFSYKQAVSVIRNGATIFQGFVAKIDRTADGRQRAMSYTFYDWWWLAERLIFKQPRKVFAGWTGGVPGSAPLLALEFTTEVWIGEKLDVMGVVYQTNGSQLVDVLNWINECYNPTRRGATGGIDATQDVIQVGQIDPVANIPKSMVRSPSCASMMINLLRWSPECVVCTDHSTTPPTINVFSETNLTEVEIDITAEQERQIQLSAKFDRQLAGVLIYFLTSITANGVTFPDVVIQKYPDGTGGDGPAITEYTPDVSTHTIDLVGGFLGNRTVLQVVNFEGVADGDDDVKKAWLIARDTTLQDPTIDTDSIVLKSFKVFDDATGAEISDFSDTPNELLRTPAAEFTGAAILHVNVKAQIQYTRYNDPEHTTVVDKGIREFNRQLTLTDAVTTTYTDRAAGEAVPADLAKSMYNSVKTLKHEGSIDFLNLQARGDIVMGVKLTLVGPHHTYENCLVQTCAMVPHSGLVPTRFGPSSVLDASDLLEMMRATRLANFFLPSGRADATGGGVVI